MDQSDLEAKYKKIATEYSKLRSQANVLKKALLDEQAKSADLRTLVKEHEQRIRKSDQEMESLVFRNDQLTKRISVLQQELQQQSNVKKHNKNKAPDNISNANINDAIHNEELHKKILENAQLISAMADKDQELASEKEKVEWLENRISKLQKTLDDIQMQHKKEIEQLKHETNFKEDIVSVGSSEGQGDYLLDSSKWQKEAERWKTEYELLKSKPDSTADISDYYESRIREAIIAKQKAQSEVSSLWAESLAISAHLENAIQEKLSLEKKEEKYNEDIATVNDNYRSQLDAMTEHLASLNDTIARQCDQIQHLQHQLSNKK